MKEFISKNKVILLGALGAIGVALTSFVGQPELQIKPLVFAVVAALLAYLANNLRGQWVSIAGILGMSLTTFITMEQTGTVSWQQLILQAVVAFIAVVASPPKPQGYEQTAIIKKAVEQGAAIQEKAEETPPPQLGPTIVPDTKVRSMNRGSKP